MSTGRRKFHIKAGDTVYVAAGKEKGKTGKVLRIDRDAEKAFVEKLNIIKRHSRPTQKNPAGGIVEKEAGIHFVTYHYPRSKHTLSLIHI